MEAIPFILFILVWIFLYKYLVNKKQKGKVVSHLFSLVVATIAMLISILLLAPDLTPEQKAQLEEKRKQETLKELAERKQEELKEFENELLVTIGEAKSFELYKLENFAKRYVESKSIDASYNKKFYDCLGSLVWDKNESFTVGKMLDWCYDDYKLSKEHKMKQYYNTAWLMKDFSFWNGSYKPLVELVKKAMHNSDSFEHIKTIPHFVYHGVKRPHVSIKMEYKGTNAFNAIVKGEVSIKVDALTKEIYDIKE